MITEIKTIYKCSVCGKEYNNKEEALSCEKRHNKEETFDNIKEFELKHYHLDLLKKTWIDWDDCEYGAPTINCKRPYGNSNVEDDIADIIRMPKKDNWDENEDMWNDKAKEKLYDIHRETQIALQIVLHCQTFKLGKYRKKGEYGQEWEFVE